AGPHINGRLPPLAGCVVSSNHRDTIVAGVDDLFDLDLRALEVFDQGTRELYVSLASEEIADPRCSHARSTASQVQRRNNQSLAEGPIERGAGLAARRALLEEVERSPHDFHVLLPHCPSPRRPYPTTVSVMVSVMRSKRQYRVLAASSSRQKRDSSGAKQLLSSEKTN